MHCPMTPGEMKISEVAGVYRLQGSDRSPASVLLAQRLVSLSSSTESTSGLVVFWRTAATSPALRKARRTLPPRILWMSASE